MVPRIGILGNGQLAKMLVEAALPMGVKPIVYSGDTNNIQSLAKFLEQVDRVVFESEFFNPAILRTAADRVGKPDCFYPSLKTMQTFRDKLSQKKLLTSLRIPTAEFQELTLSGPLGESLNDLA